MPNHQIIPDEGLARILASIVQLPVTGVTPWMLRLFVNDIEPDRDTVLADLVEASFGGYGAYTMVRSYWTDPVVTDHKAKSTWKTTATTWTVTSSPETVYGMYYTDDDFNVIRGVYRFDSPYVLEVGGKLGVIPEMTLASEQFVAALRRRR